LIFTPPLEIAAAATRKARRLADTRSLNLNTGPRDMAELTTGHIIFFTLYVIVNEGTWSLMY